MNLKYWWVVCVRLGEGYLIQSQLPSFLGKEPPGYILGTEESAPQIGWNTSWEAGPNYAPISAPNSWALRL